MKILTIILFTITANISFAQESTNNKSDTTFKQQDWTLHFQSTMIDQYHGNYNFPYSGRQSLDSNAEKALSLTATLFIGRRLWKNAAIYFSPEITGGSGFSGTHGIAGFPNGEIYRVGNPSPTPFIAKAYFQQTFPLGGTTYEKQTDGPLQLQGLVPTSRITINVGKFCLADFFDDNSYDHDARSQFLNWSLMANGAWDFAADTRGYTSGTEIELVKPTYAIKFSFTQMSILANGEAMDWNLLRSNAMGLEFAAPYKLFTLGGVIRIDGYRNSSRAPKYSVATAALLRGDTSYVAIIDGTSEGTYRGIKYGYGINIEQPITKDLGMFFRYGYNDGKTASWEFTDIDNNVQLGINLAGAPWERPDDALGIAVASNGISKDHQEYLEAGGYSFIIGDGHLDYGREQVFEAYYRIKFDTFFYVSPDYQLILNPGYNISRAGPISIPGVRLHVEF